MAIDRNAQRFVVDCLQAREVIVVDQHLRQRGDKLVAGGAGYRPVSGELFPFGENLFDRDVAVGPGGLPQALQIAQRIRQAVDMVNAQAVHHARVDQLKDQPVRIVEDRIILNPDADQPGDLKEAPPRELLRRLPPGHQPPALRLVQLGNALLLAVRARVKRILGVVVNQRGLFRDRVTF